ncbi:tetratricopeptide repeat protein [Duganella sp. SAP-35]|uniref:Tetratricopeptide repeat protein n=2 Tax=Duganella aceris TaxID=2703883 RepID=A0ABX0FJD6_9BURK|nr:tetratricopeptide repeat protein [Duganella aceris]
MQALKKAERAKQNSVPEEELDKPSQAFDDILALTPEPVAAPAAAPLAKRELSLDLEPMAAFSLEPLTPPAPSTGAEPRPSPNPDPAPSDHQAAGLTLDLAPDPAAPPAPARPFPPPAPAATTPPANPPTAVPSAAAPPSAAAGKPAGAAQAARSAKADARKPRGAARARAAAAAEPTGIDPERMRLAGLIAMLLLILGGFGFYYWQAVMAPGAGSRLPPVPMPPPDATSTAPAPLLVAADTVPGAGDVASPAIDPAAGAAPAPASPAGRDDLERRLTRTEQELAIAQQAIQAQQSAPRADKLPPIAAADNGEIRVARAVQPSAVSPALDGAYQSFNRGDLTAAQQQYETALRQDGNSRDALLGLAALSARQNQGDKAASYYQRLLELDPADSAATAGLIGLRQGDAGQSESRLKAALAANPEAAPLLFALGNLYAQQGRWSEAQQTYFRAFSAAPDNPDYAFNLAIGLDRLNQGKLALTYYQRALALAQDKAVGFDRNALRQRMHELGATAH